jgi:type I restriction enzyme R subunit
MLEDGLFDPEKPWFIRWGRLPHWRQDGGTYFVTFRLSDSLPQAKLNQLKTERLEWLNDHPNPSIDDLRDFDTRLGRKLNRWLDQGYGSCVLSDREAREIVERALRHFDGERYELGDFTVAPNHVHALLRMALDQDVSSVLYSWKHYSANRLLKIDRIARAFGTDQPHFWQKESFDHLVRNVRSLEKFAEYIRNHER